MQTNNNPLISIIVPIYNVEEFLSKCIESILNQTFENFELILVNDGSQDRSGIIAEEYRNKDCRIKVINKINGGLSSARNAGLDIAKGKYVGFIDSDDYISPNMFMRLYTNLEKEKADLSACGYYKVYSNRLESNNRNDYMVLDTCDAIAYMLESTVISVMACNKLYKKEIFNTVRYPEGKLSEDAFVIVDILGKCKKVVIDCTPEYYYVQRNNSITNGSFTAKQLDVVEAYNRNFNIIKEQYPRIENIGRKRLCWAYYMVLDRIILSRSEKEYKQIKDEMIKKILDNFKFIVFEEKYSLQRKLATIALRINPDLYSLIIRMKNKNNVFFTRGDD